MTVPRVKKCHDSFLMSSMGARVSCTQVPCVSHLWSGANPEFMQRDDGSAEGCLSGHGFSFDLHALIFQGQPPSLCPNLGVLPLDTRLALIGSSLPDSGPPP